MLICGKKENKCQPTTVFLFSTSNQVNMYFLEVFFIVEKIKF